jgi:hypothetical protein
MSDRQPLAQLLTHFADRASHGPLTLGEVTDDLGTSGFSILCAILSLPFLVPVSLGPLATVGGITLFLIGIQVLRGAEHPRLPEKVRKLIMPPQAWRNVAAGLDKIVKVCQKFSRPRRQNWIEGSRGAQLRGLVITAAGFLMALPLFGMPFNNALPAFAIVLVCLAEDDGVLALLAVAATAVSAIYIGGILIAVLFIGRSVLGL